MAADRIIKQAEKDLVLYEGEGGWVEMGGPGSGHFRHRGRKGKRGGSAPRGAMDQRWSKQEISALGSFSWLKSQTINSELRRGKVSTTKPFGTGTSNAEQVALIDSAIAKAEPTRSDIILHSKMDAVYLWRAGKLKVGEVINNPGYLSVSERKGGVRAHPSVRYSKKAILNLNIPKGTKGILPLANVSRYPQEKEHLIRRGSKYRIDRIKEPDNPYIDPWTIGATLL